MFLPFTLRSVRFFRFVLILICASDLSADDISWWRFETDLDGSANGFENPNEVAGGSSLISSNAVLGTSAPDLFSPVVPGPGVPNTASVRAVNTGGTSGIFGSADYSSALDVGSVTVEFWVRTTESDAGFVARTTSPNAGEQGSISNGFRIVAPNSVRVDFWTSREIEFNGTDFYVGSRTQTTIDTGISINDGDWHYIAFSYDENSGAARLIVDFEVTEIDLADNRALYWGGNFVGATTPDVTMGYRLDGNQNNNIGTLDEVRFTDEFEDNEDLLSPVPEPGTLSMGVMIALFVAYQSFIQFRRRASDS